MVISVKVLWKLRIIMAHRNMTNVALAEASGFSVNTIRKWRAADEQPRISSQEIAKLAKALDCTTDDLTGHGEF